MERHLHFMYGIITLTPSSFGEHTFTTIIAIKQDTELYILSKGKTPSSLFAGCYRNLPHLLAYYPVLADVSKRYMSNAN